MGFGRPKGKPKEGERDVQVIPGRVGKRCVCVGVCCVSKGRGHEGRFRTQLTCLECYPAATSTKAVAGPVPRAEDPILDRLARLTPARYIISLVTSVPLHACVPIVRALLVPFPLRLSGEPKSRRKGTHREPKQIRKRFWFFYNLCS